MISAVLLKFLRQLILYTGVGAIGTAAHYGTLISLVELAHVRAVLGSVCGFIVGAFVNYYLNYHCTFASTKSHAIAIPQFFCVALVGLLLTYLVMIILTEVLDQNYLIAQLISTAIVLFTGFVINKYWTFGGEDGHRES